MWDKVGIVRSGEGLSEAATSWLAGTGVCLNPAIACLMNSAVWCYAAGW
jgi:hypothetical protein